MNPLTNLKVENWDLFENCCKEKYKEGIDISTVNLSTDDSYINQQYIEHIQKWKYPMSIQCASDLPLKDLKVEDYNDDKFLAKISTLNRCVQIFVLNTSNMQTQVKDKTKQYLLSHDVRLINRMSFELIWAKIENNTEPYSVLNIPNNSNLCVIEEAYQKIKYSDLVIEDGYKQLTQKID